MSNKNAYRANTIGLVGEYITLAQALKVAAFADNGGHAKAIVRNGQVSVNGVLETQPGKKLRVGDQFAVDGGPAWTIQG